MLTPPRIIRAISLVLATALGSTVWAQKADAPAPEVGDKWTYKFTNIGDKRDPTSFFMQVMHVDNQSAWLYGESTDTQAISPQFAWRYDLKRAGLMERFLIDLTSNNKLGVRNTNNQPNDDSLKFPLEVGKEWAVKENWTNAEGVSGFTEYKAKVEAFEKIKVAAGEFDVYKVSFKGFWNQRVGGSWSGRAERVIWYAPLAKMDVKRTSETRHSQGGPWNKNETELIKWEPKAVLGNYPVVGLRAEAAPAGAAVTAATPTPPASATR